MKKTKAILYVTTVVTEEYPPTMYFYVTICYSIGNRKVFLHVFLCDYVTTVVTEEYSSTMYFYVTICYSIGNRKVFLHVFLCDYVTTVVTEEYSSMYFYGTMLLQWLQKSIYSSM